MKPFANWNEVSTIMSGANQQLPAGVYIGKIVNVKLDKSKAGDEMLVLAMDIAEGEYKDFFRKVFDRRMQYKKEGQEIKWSCQYYQLTGAEGDVNRQGRFKGMLTAIEMSNDGYSWDWDEMSLKGKICGCIFGEEEYKGTDNKVHTSTKCVSIIPVSEMENAKVPEKKCIEPQEGQSFIPVSSNGFNEEIPF